jgi:hypothetical protein
MNNGVDKIMRYVAPLVIAAAAVLMTAFFLNEGNRTSSDNNVYVRYIACALSVAPDKRDDAVIEACWDHVIKESGNDVHRYDNIEDDNHFWLRDQ